MKTLSNYLQGAGFALALLISPSLSLAMPALDTTISLQQPDGQTFEAVPVGDEWNNRMETTAGYTVARDASAVWRYVKGFGPGKAPILSAVPAQDSAPPGLEKHLSAGSQRPQGAPGAGGESGGSDSPQGAATVATSTPVLFILTEFSDQKGATPESAWTDMLSNNVVDYYHRTSHGNAALSPAADSSGIAGNGVINWVDVGYNHPNTAGSTGSVNRQLSADAIAAADPYVDYSAYDSNGDGFLQGHELSIVVIVAGYETAYGGAGGTLSPSVWGHRWGWGSGFPTVDGVRITDYAQFGEYHATSLSNKHQATMGIIVHELGHLTFSLPDLYDTDGSSQGIGAFGLMSGGSWGAASSDSWAGETPVNASAWSKYVMNWVEGQEGSGVASVTASGDDTAGTTTTAVYRASTPVSNQYFLVENRQPVGYDLGLERYLGANFSGGLAIWHVDDSRSNNANDSHRWVDMEEADGSDMVGNRGSTADLWRSVIGTAFAAATDPDSRLYDGTDSGVGIADVSTPGAVMTATFESTPEPPSAEPSDPYDPAAIDNADGSATVTWSHDGINVTHFEVVREKEHKRRAGQWTNATVLPAVPYEGGTSFNLVDASGTGNFRYTVRAFNSDLPSTGSASVIVEVTDSTGGGGGGGGGGDKPCRGKKCSG